MGYDTLPSDDGSWNFLELSNSGSQSGSPSVAFLHSPASRSLSSYGVVTHVGQGGHGLSSSPGSGGFHYNHSPEPLTLPRPPTSSPAQPVSASDQQPRADFPSADQLASLLSYQISDQVNTLDTSSASLGSSAYATNQYIPALADAAGFAQNAQNTTLTDYQLQELTDFCSTNLLSQTLQTENIPTPPRQLGQEQQQQQTISSIPNYLKAGTSIPSWNSVSLPDSQMSKLISHHGSEMNSLSPESLCPAIPVTTGISQSTSSRLITYNQSDVEPLNQLEFSQLRQMLYVGQSVQTDIAQQVVFAQHEQLAQEFWTQQAQELQQLHLSQTPSMTPLVHGATDTVGWVSTSAPAPSETKTSPLHSSSKPILSRLGQSSISINKVRGSSTRVTKKKASHSSSDKLQLSSSAESSSGDDRFVIFTPKSVSTQSDSGGRFNPFECFEAMSATQKGRKGPLAEEVKENALQVRRAGACFCCHSRKVKCDAQLPCKNCIKLTTHLPQAICWRFDDFLGPLFPTLIRSHFRKDNMATFISENIDSFYGDTSHTIHLSSGLAFNAELEVRNVRIFRPVHASSALQHAHLQSANNLLQVSLGNSLPMALDLSENLAVAALSQQEKIKKALRTYVDTIIKEDAYVDTVTERLRGSELPKKILTITRNFYLKTNSPIVKQALYIYTMQYMMMHHLVITDQSLKNLLLAGHIFPASTFHTSRLLNRQIKAILDELMQEEVDKLFRMFTRELKPKARMAWATCLAAFLIFCLFMESTGLSIDNYVITENQISLDNKLRAIPDFSRAVVVKLSRELENLPFRQFAFQFHNIYQTHQLPPSSISSASTSSISTSSSTSSPSSSSPGIASTLPGVTSSVKASFNPLVDDAPLLAGDLDKHARELVTQLRALLSGDSWSELDYLTFDFLIDSIETHPYPKDISLNYTGRLCSKFLLSFQNQNYILTPA
ncbi:hypothetical protein SEPCBS57363_004341 [Sporothrix epigloea]|uniref:Zn(2)-C6 fungal-type domain-containing protein n=1 Tax=Sporothrix epigloea TaxID=1892477 RepID=A0ABP0DSQ1_9PEZI